MAAAFAHTAPPVVIAGAGLSGLSLAALLTSKRVRFILLEASARHDERPSYSLALHRWAFEPLIRGLLNDQNDLEPAIRSCERAFAIDGDVSESANPGRPFAPSAATGNYSQLFANHRRLREWLLQRVHDGSVRWGAKIVDVKTDLGGVTVRVAGGEEIGGRCLVAADGVQSTVRSVLLPDAVPTPLPFVANTWQHRLTRAVYDALLAQSFRNTNVLRFDGPRGLRVRASVVDIDSNRAKVSWAFSRRFDPMQGQPSLDDDRMAVYADVQKDVYALGTLSPPSGYLVDRPTLDDDELCRMPVSSLSIVNWDLDRLCERNVILIGDAAHAMPLLASEGGSHGMLDGVELAAVLADAGDEDEMVTMGRNFYAGAVERWRQGLEESEWELGNMHDATEERQDW